MPYHAMLCATTKQGDEPMAGDRFGGCGALQTSGGGGLGVSWCYISF